jgi:hypothetical protein
MFASEGLSAALSAPVVDVKQRTRRELGAIRLVVAMPQRNVRRPLRTAVHDQPGAYLCGHWVDNHRPFESQHSAARVRALSLRRCSTITEPGMYSDFTQLSPVLEIAGCERDQLVNRTRLCCRASSVELRFAQFVTQFVQGVLLSSPLLLSDRRAK